MEMRSYTVMLKPAGPDCSLACEYCFYLEKRSLFPGRLTPRMTEEVLEAFTQQYIAAGSSGEITFV